MAWTQGEKTAMTVFGLALAGVAAYVIFEDGDEVAPGFIPPFFPPVVPPVGPVGPLPPVGPVGPIIATPTEPIEPVVIIPSQPVIPPITGVPVVEPPLPQIFVPQIEVPDVFMASEQTCGLNQEGFNIIQWSQSDAGAIRVAEVMTILGFPISGEAILAADRVRAKSKRLWNSGVAPKGRHNTIRAFQAALISRAIAPYILADPDEVDGIMGECALIGLTNAVSRFNAGDWPVPG